MEQKTKTRLDEVTLMRAILALLIVFMHSFTCYDGCWSEPEGYVDVPLYKWLSRTSFAFTLEAFVFISGYLFAFQRITLKRGGGGGISLIINKLKRLILPSVIFSVFYYVLFYDYKGVGNLIYSIINGCGHMWYLPMLFWCFIGGWLLEQIKIRDGWKFAFLIVLNLLAIIGLPLRLTNAFSFMVYFYAGFLFYKNTDRIKPLITPKRIVVSWSVFAVVFSVFRPLRDILVTSDDQSIYMKLLFCMGNNFCQLLYASVGLIAFYCSVIYITQKRQLSEATRKIAACCFGIYLFQQFVLQMLYYKTSFPLWVGPYWLPWIGFILTAILSFAITNVLLKTKTGRFLFG